MPVRTPDEPLRAGFDAGARKASLSAGGSYGRFAVLSVLAGAYIALGATLSLIVGFGFPEATASNPSLQRLLSGLVFPIGLMLVVVLGAELFTGNNALLMPPLIRRELSFAAVAKNWTLVWLGNFAGSLAVAYFMVYLCGLTSPEPYHSAICRIAEAKVSASPWVIFLKGIGANWCVCLAVWLALSGRRLGEKLIACQIPVMAFVILGYEHCVANMFFIPLGIMEGAEVGILEMFGANLLPATVGNIIGGAVFVGCAHYYLHRKSL